MKIRNTETGTIASISDDRALPPGWEKLVEATQAGSRGKRTSGK